MPIFVYKQNNKMSNKIKHSSEAPIASINGEKTTEFSLTIQEENALIFNVSVMSDFDGVKELMPLRKFHKNAAILRDHLKSLTSDEEAIQIRMRQINDRSASGAISGDELAEVRESFSKERDGFYNEKRSVSLYTVPAKLFPTDREKFGTRDYYFAPGDSRPVKYVSSYLDLIEAGVITE